MYIIELILSMQVNDFPVLERDEINNAISKAQECQQTTEYSDQCANVVEKWLHKKDQLGGLYVNYQ